MELPPFEISVGQVDGIVRCVVRGFWTMETVAAYFAKLDPLLREKRLVDGRVKALIDRRDAEVQAPAVSERMMAAGSDMREQDRIARVVNSTLAGMQLRRLFTHPGDRVFTAIDEAEVWLRGA